MSEHVVAVVQARLGSSRLPRKVLADVGGRPVLRLLLDRLATARTIDRMIVAVPDGAEDDELAAAVASWGTEVARGSSDDVLARFVTAVAPTAATVVVRLTGDCPLLDPALVDLVVDTLLGEPALDYVGLTDRFPDGADAEAFRRSALDRADREATRPSEREHVTLWMRQHPELVRVHHVDAAVDRSGSRLTIDDPADLAVVRALVAGLGADPAIGIEEYAAALERDEALRTLRAGVTRNEGLWRSMNRDLLGQIGMRHGRERSAALHERAAAVIPGATQTLSKGADQFVQGVSPVFLQSGTGCFVTDVDGNVYVDYPMALGPIILGYGHPRTVEAVNRQVAEGTTFTLPHPLEIEVAELLVDVVPCAEMVRFAKNGSDVTDGAVRLARACTGREIVLTCGYHGWHDWYVAQGPRNDGVPAVLRDLVHSFGFNDVESLRQQLAAHDGEVAAVILEVAYVDPEPGFLEAVRDLTHAAGAVLIFDEIVTGFRFAVGGAQELYGVTPDLACLGKAMANGLPLAAVVGRRDLMEHFDRVFFSGTFGGETLSLAAAKVVIEEIRAGGVIEHMWREGGRLLDGLRAGIAAAGLEIEVAGQPTKGTLLFRRDGVDDPALRGLFLQETVRRGILYGGPILTTYAHDPAVVDRTLEISVEAFEVLRTAIETDSVEKHLEGLPPDVGIRTHKL